MNWNAYHFVGDTLRDGSPIPENGVTLKHEGPLKLCRSGYHASEYVWQALEYAPGETLCRVHCGGEVIRHTDKMVCRERTVIARIDATDLLREYARWCALRVAHIWNAPAEVIEYLKTGDESIRDAARAAAWDAARAADRDAQRRHLTRMVNKAFKEATK